MKITHETRIKKVRFYQDVWVLVTPGEGCYGEAHDELMDELRTGDRSLNKEVIESFGPEDHILAAYVRRAGLEPDYSLYGGSGHIAADAHHLMREAVILKNKRSEVESLRGKLAEAEEALSRMEKGE